jgi:hypothetical protein
MFHPNFEFGAPTQESDQCGIPLGKVDAKPEGARALLAVL